MLHSKKSRSTPPFDRIAATLAALVIVGLMAFLLIRNEPIADPRLFFGLRLLLSFGAATLGASIPGFLNVGWSGGGLAVRAGGALALFVLTFVYTPDLVTGRDSSGMHINQHSEGPLSPPIVGNTGTITIQGETGPKKNETAKIDIYHLEWHPPTTNNKFSIDVHFANRGALPALSFRRSSIVYFKDANVLNDDDVTQLFTQLYSDIVTINTDSTNEIQPQQPTLYYVISGPLLGAKIDENTWGAVEKGAAYIYVLSLLQYKDENTPQNEWITTESCLYRAAGLNEACGSHNRIILPRLTGETSPLVTGR
jgi:hypothetical protein